MEQTDDKYQAQLASAAADTEKKLEAIQQQLLAVIDSGKRTVPQPTPKQHV